MKKVNLTINYTNGEVKQFFFPENTYGGLVKLAETCVKEGSIERYAAFVEEGATYKVVDREDATRERIYEDVVVAKKLVNGILCYQFCDESGNESSFPVCDWKLMALVWKEV